MSTRSFFENVSLKGEKQVQTFMRALEQVDKPQRNKKEERHTLYTVRKDNLERFLSKYC